MELINTQANDRKNKQHKALSKEGKKKTAHSSKKRLEKWQNVIDRRLTSVFGAESEREVEKARVRENNGSSFFFIVSRELVYRWLVFKSRHTHANRMHDANSLCYRFLFRTVFILRPDIVCGTNSETRHTSNAKIDSFSFLFPLSISIVGWLIAHHHCIHKSDRTWIATPCVWVSCLKRMNERAKRSVDIK